jgi:hypothetical protein
VGRVAEPRKVRPPVPNQETHPTQSVTTTDTDSLAPTGDKVSVKPLGRADAERLTDRIKDLLITISAQRDLLVSLVMQAKAGDAHAALGYQSWTAYVSAEFSHLALRFDRDDRRELVGLLAGEGMSTRAIAPVVGVDRKTVERDIAGGTSAPPEPRKITGLDGKQYIRPDVRDLMAYPSRDFSELYAAALRDRYRRKALHVAKQAQLLRKLTDDPSYRRNVASITDRSASNVVEALSDIVSVIDRLDLQRFAADDRRRASLLATVDCLEGALHRIRDHLANSCEHS